MYESSADEHIRRLHKSLAAKAWKPTYATRLYLPKPSGLQRPLSLLDIEDQIVLQAIANQFAAKLREKRQLVELKTVFSNKLTNPMDSIFFMEHWQNTYCHFQDKCTEIFNHGFRWSVHFDLSAYYDTISHDLLLSIESSKGGDSETLNTVKHWLQIWSADNSKAMTGHGIPQGPIASNFLAEAFFLPIDTKLQGSKTFRYLRYVDDIRLFGRAENDIREAAILLEQKCRHRGLIPQSTKFEIRKLNSADEAMGALPSIPSTDGEYETEQFMTAEDAHNILEDAIGGRPQKIKDKSRFRYVMYRAPKDNKILNTVLRLLPRHPEHIDAFVAYFDNYGERPRIAKEALDYLESGVPYSYVRGELWHVIARLSGIKEMQRGLPIARKDARHRKRCVALSWGVMHFLMKCDEKGLARNRIRLQSEQSISRSLLAPIFQASEFSPGGHAITLLKGTLMEKLAGARELQKRNVTLNSLNLRQRDLSDTCNSALKSLRVIRRQQQTTRDWIGEFLQDLYQCKNTSIWRDLLGTEYEHAHHIMIEVKSRFHGDRSGWLWVQDSFFDAVIRKFFEFLVAKDIDTEKNLKTINKNGNPIGYGKLIANDGKFADRYPSIANPLRTLHGRRNRIPGSHPYDQKGGAKNKWLTKKEQGNLISEIKNVCDAIATIVESIK